MYSLVFIFLMSNLWRFKQSFNGFYHETSMILNELCHNLEVELC